MRRRKLAVILIFAITTLSSGCFGPNVVVKKQAGVFVADVSTAKNTVSEFYQKLIANNNNFITLEYVLDPPGCGVYFATRKIEKRCVELDIKDNNNSRNQDNNIKIEFRLSDFEGELSVIEGFSKYIQLLADASEVSDSEVGKSVEDLLKQAEASTAVLEAFRANTAAVSEELKQADDKVVRALDFFRLVKIAFTNKKDVDSIRKAIFDNNEIFRLKIKELSDVVNGDFVKFFVLANETRFIALQNLYATKSGGGFETRNERISAFPALLAAKNDYLATQAWREMSVQRKECTEEQVNTGLLVGCMKSPTGLVLDAMLKSNQKLFDYAVNRNFDVKGNAEAKEESRKYVLEVTTALAKFITLFF